MARVAFVGLGRMGSGMALRLLAAGHDVAVCNRTLEKTRPLEKRGAQVFDTARAAAVGADVIITMTANDQSSRAAWLGEDGVLAAAVNERALAIECSTLSYDWVMELARAVAGRGLRYVDAPVTGLPANSAAGELTLLIGARAEDLEAARPVLAAFSNRVLHFGPVGAGTVYKLMINLMGAVQIAAAAEGMALAERAGLDLQLVAEAISTSQAASPQVVRNTRRIADGDHDENVAFTPVLRLKDVNYALELARQLGVSSPFGEAAREAFARLCQLGREEANESAVIEVARGTGIRKPSIAGRLAPQNQEKQ